MTWSSEDPAEESGGVQGDFRAARPRVESPMTWSLPLFRLGRVSVRMHALFLLVIAVELLRSSLPGAPRSLALPPTALLMGWFLVLSFLHEGVRTMAMRRRGGDLDEWLLWPLGGLAGADAGDDERGAARAELAGWSALLALAVANGLALRSLAGPARESWLPSPWTLEGFAQLSLGGAGALAEALWLLQWALVVSICLQALPAFPMPAGRAIAAWLRRGMGWSNGTRRVARMGVAVAVIALVAGLVWGDWVFTGLALVVWIASRETLVRVEASDALADRVDAPARASRVDPREQAELDRLLEKINRHGMGSLSFLERRRLRAATRRRQQGGGPIG